MTNRTGPRDPERETASHEFPPSDAAVCSYYGSDKMKDNYRAPGAQVATHTTLSNIVHALNDNSLIKACICLHSTEAGYHGHYIRWHGEIARIMDGPRDNARLLLRLEEIGLLTSENGLDTALWLVPTVPEGLNPIHFLAAKGDAA